VPTASRLKYYYLAYFSKPVSDRILYRTICRLQPRKILELGVHGGSRARHLISLALRHHAADELRYAGVDLFEARPPDAPAGLTLKQAHCLLKTTGVRIQLVPGDAYSALSRTANSLRDNDLMLISADQDPAALEQAWFYVPRMLHDHSVVLQEVPGEQGATSWQTVPLADIRARADQQQSRRRVA
jgi:hypothetical protein